MLGFHGKMELGSGGALMQGSKSHDSITWVGRVKCQANKQSWTQF